MAALIKVVDEVEQLVQAGLVWGKGNAMGRVLTNYLSLAFSVEASIGVLEGTPTWKQLEPNTVGTFGAAVSKMAREPISKNRQRRKGATVDLDSSVEFEHDLTKAAFLDFIEGFTMASALYPYSGGTTRQGPIQSGALFQDLLAFEGAPDSFKHDALTTAMTEGRLVFARGFANATNNGMHVVDAASAVAETKVTSTDLVNETPSNGAGATLEIAGHRFAVGDLEIAVAVGVATLTVTVADFTTLGLTVGQVIHVGGLLTANQFSAGAGFGRITAIAAKTITLDKLDAALTTDNGVGETVELLFGSFIRNVAVDSSSFAEKYFQFEMALPNLDPAPADMYEYAKGNRANQVTFNLPLADKAAATFGFVGTDTAVPTTVRATNADTPVIPVQTAPLNTTADIARLRVTDLDELGMTTVFKSVSLVLDNQVTPDKSLGTLGAVYMNTGNFLVNLETQVLLTHASVVAAIRNNTTVTMDFILTNEDGAICVDIPAMTLGDGSKELPVNESVMINLAGEAFQDATLGYSLGVSVLPAVP